MSRSEGEGGKNPKAVWWNDEIKAAFRRKESSWKEALPVSDEEAKERCMEGSEREEGCRCHQISG